MVNIVSGNLIDLAEDGLFDIIIHGCNCRNTMGAGIAREIKRRYQEAYTVDTEAANVGLNTLGNISVADCNSFLIVNAYTQDDWRGYNNIDYKALRAAMKKINTQFKGKSVGFPKIGAGLAGGDWNIISNIIDEELTDVVSTLVIYT